MKYVLGFAAVILVLLCGCGNENMTDQPTSNRTVEAASENSTIGEDRQKDIQSMDEPDTEATGAVKMVTGVEISFELTRMSTIASNQFAVWIEDVSGALVKTIFVTDFTAGRRGYRNRDMSLSAWVAKAQPETLSDSEIDAISGATPQTGSKTFVWDMTDTDGKRVPDGIYQIMVEGTFYWESNILYSAVLNTESDPLGALPVTSVRSDPDNIQNEEMITNVMISVNN